METYWITGVQLGMLEGFCRTEQMEKAEELIEEIIEKQQTDNKVRKIK